MPDDTAMAEAILDALALVEAARAGDVDGTFAILDQNHDALVLMTVLQAIAALAVGQLRIRPASDGWRQRALERAAAA